MGLFRDSTEITIISPLSPTECILRLRQKTIPFWKFWGRPVIGRFKGNATAFLRRRKRIRTFCGIWSLAYLKIKMTKNNNGTSVQCRPGIYFIHKITLSMIYPFYVYSYFEIFNDPIFSELPQDGKDFFIKSFYLILFVFIPFFYIILIFFYNKDKRYLINFVKENLS